MLAFRLVFLIAMVVGLLTAIAVSSSDRDERNGRSATTAPLPAATLTATKTVEAKLPHDGPVEANVGDMIVLRFTPKESDVLELDAFGFEQGIAGDVASVVRIVAARPGTFDLRLRGAEKTLATLKVAPRPPISGGTAAS
ncbi:MAG: hypothetical protein ITG02_11580 [Patulibacter sp.]|nr:hypothetical protein [Patulibacter sp.]